MAELTPEQIRLEQERLDLIQKQTQAAKELASTYDKMGKGRPKLTQDEKDLLGLTRQVADMSATIEKSINKRLSGSASIKDLEKSVKELKNDQIRNENTLKNYADQINEQKRKAIEGFKKSSKEERNLQQEIKDQLEYQDGIYAVIERLKRSTNAEDKDRLKAAKAELRNSQELQDYAEKRLKKVLETKDKQKELFKQLDESKKAHEKIAEKQKEELELAKQAVVEARKKSILDVLGEQFRAKEIAQMFTLAGIMKMILDGAMRYNAISVQISKNTGYGADQANRVASNLKDIAQTSSNVNVTLKSLGEAMNDLNTATGGVAEYSKDTLETQVMLTKQFGLTGEEAAGIYKFSVLTGKSSSQVNKEMAGAFASTRNMVGGSANFKATMAEVSKISGQLAANFKNNPAELTKAVVQAQALGTTLEQTKNQAAGLLDFESSIENELKAELLTGQQMNLERARAAALQGDQVTVMKELANQGMTLEKFSSMNVLAQESFAKALGLSADQLADQLKKQKIAQEQGKSLAQITEEEALEAQKRQAIQDKFNAAVEKLQDIIGNLLAGPLGKVLDVFSTLLSQTWLLYTVLGLIAFSRIGSIAKGLMGVGGILKDAVGNAGKLFTGKGGSLLGGGGAAPTPTPSVPDTKAGGGGLGKFVKGINPASMMKAAASILILAGALFVAAKAFQQFASVKWEDMAKAGVALVGLSLVAMALGKAKGAILEGAVAVAILGVALIPLAYALNLAAPAIEAFGNVVLKVFTGLGTVITAASDGIVKMFDSLQNVSVSKLLAIGPALTMIGIGLASLGAGGVIGAIGKFIGGDPIKKIQKLAESGDGLQKAATGLQGIASALTQVSAALSTIDSNKLKELSNFSAKMAVGSAIKGITDFITAPIKMVSGAVNAATGGGTGGGQDNAELIKAVREVKAAIDKLYSKDTSINMDSKQVGTSLTQKSTRLA